MRFRALDTLAVFDVVARHSSFTAAADELSLTKGAISYQIKRLERELGFEVFTRLPGGIALTEKGKKLWSAAQTALNGLQQEIAALREASPGRITIGMSTYFASRWLSPRLMIFMSDHPRIGLRIQPLIDLIDVRTENIDMAIRWGKGQWTDMEMKLLFTCPAMPTAGAEISRRIEHNGLETVLPDLTLLHDREGSEAWLDWHNAAGLPYRSTRDGLVVPDPNVRVQAVIDGQGLALNDSLVAAELSTGRLFKVSTVELSHYGYYLAYPGGALNNPGLRAFHDWIMVQAKAWQADHHAG